LYIVKLSKQAEKDKLLLKKAGLDKKAKALLNILIENPYQNPPSYEKLKGDLDGYYSRRMNRQHRIVYSILEAEKTVKILSMWTHYE
jgi:Txe/YoeB family toxin of toxin-antitoxin system